MQDLPGQLTLEQEFKLEILKEEIKGLSLDQAQRYVIEITRQMMVKDNLVKHLLQNEI